MIFVQAFKTTFGTNPIILSFHWSKMIEREKGRERIRM